jgi:hypothetical protein
LDLVLVILENPLNIVNEYINIRNKILKIKI